MGFSGILGTGLTAATNPNPNNLATITPYPTPYINSKTVSTAWTSQASKALFPRQALNGQGLVPIPILLIPSSPGATFTATIWQYDKTSNTWFQNVDTPAINFNGETGSLIINIYSDTPIFIQLSSISLGTITINFDNGLAVAA